MDKKELEEKIEKLQNDFEELDKKLKETKELLANYEEKPQEDVRPRLKYDDYWWLDTTNEAHHRRDILAKFDNIQFQSGNYYYTKEQCLKNAKLKLTKQQLKDLALRLNKGVEINWEDENQLKYSIKLDYISGGLSQTQAKYSRYPSAICCLDDRFIQIARQEIGEEKLIELIKSGV